MKEPQERRELDLEQVVKAASIPGTKETGHGDRAPSGRLP